MRERRPLLTTRWLALGAGGGAACALALDQFGLAGPWQKIALLLVLLAMFAISAWLYATHERERDLSETSEKARHGEELIERLQQEIALIRVEASAGGGMVSIKMDGQKNVLAVKIDPEVAGDVEMLQDMVLAAVNEALKAAEELAETEMGKITGGMGMPGLF